MLRAGVAVSLTLFEKFGVNASETEIISERWYLIINFFSASNIVVFRIYLFEKYGLKECENVISKIYHFIGQIKYIVLSIINICTRHIVVLRHILLHFYPLKNPISYKIL